MRFEDFDFDLEQLKGDCYKPEANPDIPEDILKAEELAFEERVEAEGVHYYQLEKMDRDGIYKHLDGCGGFVGTDTEEHGIIPEYKYRIYKESMGDNYLALLVSVRGAIGNILKEHGIKASVAEFRLQMIEDGIDGPDRDDSCVSYFIRKNRSNQEIMANIFSLFDVYSKLEDLKGPIGGE
jgi:hypothetical protein